jgi:hypothetical protein
MMNAVQNIPRFEANQIDITSRGILIERASRNILPWSSDLNNEYWLKDNVTFSKTQFLAPTKREGMYLLTDTPDSSNKVHSIFAQTREDLQAGINYTFSLFVKINLVEQIKLSLFGFAFPSNPSVTFTVPSLSQSVSGPALAGVRTLDGYNRIWITATAEATGFGGVAITLGNGTSFSYTGDGDRSINIWGPQLEPSLTPTSYIQTGSLEQTREPDNCELSPEKWFDPLRGTFLIEWANCSGEIGGSMSRLLSSNIPADLLFFSNPTGYDSALNISTNNGASTLNLTLASDITKPVTRAGISYNTTGRILSCRGQVASDSQQFLLFNPTRLFLGGGINSQFQCNGIIRRFIWRPEPYTTSQLQAWTT